MNLYEFEGKSLFKKYAIPVPDSVFVTDPSLPPPLPFPFVLKAQVLTGGRGKAGGVRVCKDAAGYAKDAAEILGMTIKDRKVNGLLCEEMVHANREIYLAITLQGVTTPTLIACAAGGMEIEQVAKTDPDKIIKIPIDPFIGLKGYQLKRLAAGLGVEDAKALGAFVTKLQEAFMSLGATLVEINPLGVVDNKLIAMDSKVILDDHAACSKSLIQSLDAARVTLPNYEAEEKEPTTITFVSLQDGDVGLISDGAGTGMLTLDLLSDEGAKVSSFCELGGVTPAEVMYRAMLLTMSSGRPVKAIMVALIGGFNRMDDMANGITGYIRDHGLDVPIYTRMCGTMEEEGKAIMAQAGLQTYDDLGEAVRLCAAKALEVK